MLNLAKKLVPRRLGGSKDNIYNRFFDWWAEESFRRTVHGSKPSNILEIGVFEGRSAVRMIDAARKAGAHGICYYGFDIFDSPPSSEPNSKNEKGSMEKVEELLSGTGTKFRLFKGNTMETLPKAAPRLPKMDFVYIDGGHSYETVKSDWESVRKLLHKKSVVMFDDYNMDGVKRVVDGLRKEYRISIVAIGIEKRQAVLRHR